MKNIEVVAAIIVKDGCVLSTKRLKGEFAGQWEFPGGKVEPNETNEQALIREIQEELNADIIVKEFLCTVKYQYPNFHLTMHCYICNLVTSDFVLNDHSDAKWLTKDTLDTVEWLPADIEILSSLKQYLSL